MASERPAPPKTPSELLFERYLLANGYAEFEFEPTFDGKAKHPDYLVRWNGCELLFEVKERIPPHRLPESGQFDQFDPYRGIRDEIKQAKRKFREFKEYCCCLVIANLGDPKSFLEPEFIFGAMLGNLAVTFTIPDCDSRQEPQTVQSVFGRRRGKMIGSYKKGAYHNTPISAVVALQKARLRNPAFEKAKARAVHEEQRKRNRLLSVEERVGLESKVVTGKIMDGLTYPRVPRAVVCENPGARIRLPCDILCGPFDERWAIVDHALTPIYAGVRVPEIVKPDVAEELCSHAAT